MLINLLMEYNERALEIATKHPDDYHRRADYRAVIDERSEAQITTERKAPNEKSAA